MSNDSRTQKLIEHTKKNNMLLSNFKALDEAFKGNESTPEVEYLKKYIAGESDKWDSLLFGIKLPTDKGENKASLESMLTNNQGVVIQSKVDFMKGFQVFFKEKVAFEDKNNAVEGNVKEIENHRLWSQIVARKVL